MDLRQRLSDRLTAIGLEAISPERLSLHESYFSLLSKWNRTINLTALPLDPITDEAIDRLLVEPIAASRFAGDARSIVDLGSGGGSPAIPFWIEVPGAHLTMVESRSRKCAFLREAVRQIAPGRGTALDVRFEELLDRHPELAASADIVTIRAVRLDEPMVTLLAAILKPGGKVFRFANANDPGSRPGLSQIESHLLFPGGTSELQILTCSTWNNWDEKRGSS